MMTFQLLRVLVAFACLVLAPTLVRAQQKSATSFRVGMAFRSYTPKEPYNWRGAKTHALLATIWYPAVDSAVEQPLQVPGLNIFLLGSVGAKRRPRGSSAEILAHPAVTRHGRYGAIARLVRYGPGSAWLHCRWGESPG
jgi:hypothetical protein